MESQKEVHKLKVVHVVWSAALGGIDTVVSALVKEQLATGTISPALLIAKKTPVIPPHWTTAGIPVTVAGFKAGFRYSTSARQRCDIAFASADIIHIHSFNPVIASAAIASGKKIVYTEHGNFGFGRRRTIGDRISAILLKRFLNRSVSLLTFNSLFSGSVSEQRYGLEKVRKEVIYNGCPPLPDPLPEYQSSAINLSAIQIVTVGRLALVKRFNRLISAFAVADNKALQLIITGDGPLRSTLQEQVQKTGIEKQVVFTGAQPSIAMFRHADICVFPSTSEAFGLVAIEAWQLGKPVVVFSDGGGLAELTSQIEPALVMENEQALISFFRQLEGQIGALQSESLQTKRKAFAARFTSARMAERFNELYSTL